MKKFAIATWLFSFASLTMAQSAKTIRTYGIEKKTETVVKYYEGQEVARYIEEIERYNSEGDWIEKLLFDSNGNIKLKQNRIYEKDEVVDETNIDYNGSRAKESKPPSYHRSIFEYEKGDLISEKKLDEDGNILFSLEHSYNKLGDLIEIRMLDAAGTHLEREVIEYDDRGLKVKETSFRGEDTVVKEKMFVYE